MQLLDIDLADPNLEETPRRVARMYAALLAGNDVRSEPALKTFPNSEGYNQMVSVRDISFFSMCAHHLLPFFGNAHIGYVPGDRIVGLSKLARVVDFYARRPQLQENLTEQIVGYLERELQPQGVVVVLQARHLCMEMRGVHKPGALTSTSALRGHFEGRDELLQLFQQA